jgi:hypothetical protein
VRVLGVIALALLVTGAATAGSGRTTVPPLSLGGVSELNGFIALGGSSAGQRLRFLPDRKFAVGLVLQSESQSPVVVEKVEVLEPRRTLIHQTGARFHRWKTAACPPGADCPATTFPIGSGIAHHPRPVTVEPGAALGVELDFRLGSCVDVPGASSAPISRLRVTYRTRGSSENRHVYALGSDALRLRMPKPEDCVSPRSSLFVNDPSHIGTSYLFTIPGSKGDVCTRTGHGLVFRSRAMKNNDRAPERVVIRLSAFAGPAPYDGARVAVVVGGKTLFHTRALLEVTKSNGREVFTKVRAHRIQGWMRCRISG